MTDAEIMKGVKLCNGDLGNCKECPFDSIGKTCGIELAKAEIGLIERLQAENAAFRNEADENAALSMENKMRADRLEKENAALRERLGKWAVDNEIVMEPRVKDGQTYYVISRKERRIVTHYICTELTPEAAEARLKELQGGEE